MIFLLSGVDLDNDTVVDDAVVVATIGMRVPQATPRYKETRNGKVRFSKSTFSRTDTAIILVELSLLPAQDEEAQRLIVVVVDNDDVVVAMIGMHVSQTMLGDKERVMSPSGCVLPSRPRISGRYT